MSYRSVICIAMMFSIVFSASLIMSNDSVASTTGIVVTTGNIQLAFGPVYYGIFYYEGWFDVTAGNFKYSSSLDCLTWSAPAILLSAGSGPSGFSACASGGYLHMVTSDYSYNIYYHHGVFEPDGTITMDAGSLCARDASGYSIFVSVSSDDHVWLSSHAYSSIFDYIYRNSNDVSVSTWSETAGFPVKPDAAYYLSGGCTLIPMDAGYMGVYILQYNAFYSISPSGAGSHTVETPMSTPLTNYISGVSIGSNTYLSYVDSTHDVRVATRTGGTWTSSNVIGHVSIVDSSHVLYSRLQYDSRMDHLVCAYLNCSDMTVCTSYLIAGNTWSNPELLTSEVSDGGFPTVVGWQGVLNGPDHYQNKNFVCSYLTHISAPFKLKVAMLSSVSPPHIISVPTTTMGYSTSYVYFPIADQPGDNWTLNTNATWLVLTNWPAIIGNSPTPPLYNQTLIFWVNVTFTNPNGTAFQNYSLNITGIQSNNAADAWLSMNPDQSLLAVILAGGAIFIILTYLTLRRRGN